jgi:ribosomal protein S3, bacterial type
MGQKVNPHGFRVGVIYDWNSRWIASKKDIPATLMEDEKLRKYIKDKLTNAGAGVSKIEIERAVNKVTVYVFTAKPGIVIGKGGTGVDLLKEELTKLVGKTVNVNIIEVRNPDANAQLIAESVAQQLERRVSFRRAMKMTLSRAMRSGAKGIKIKSAGRLGGAEIAREEGYREGSIPLQTLRADIDYGFAEAKTTYGRIGVKVWIYKGEVLNKGIVPAAEANAKAAKEPKMGDNDRRGGRGGRGGDRRRPQQGGRR